MHWAIWHSPLVLGLSVTMETPAIWLTSFLYRLSSLSKSGQAPVRTLSCGVPSGLICREIRVLSQRANISSHPARNDAPDT